MLAIPLTDPYLVYFDASVLIDLADKKQPRHRKAERLLGIFVKHHASGRLRLYTSTWAMMEAHGKLYELELTNAGMRPPRGIRLRNIRNILPVNTAALGAATEKIQKLIGRLRTKTTFTTWPPPGRDATSIWQFAEDVGREAAIWPTNSIHLSLAIHASCSLFVSDDSSFLDKIEVYEPQLIQPFRQREFSEIPNLPTFQACGVDTRECFIPGSRRRHRRKAIQILHTLGF